MGGNGSGPPEGSVTTLTGVEAVGAQDVEQAMTAPRRISLSTHAALRMATGMATMALPLLLGLSAAAVVLGVLLGAAMVGLALHAVADERGRPALPVGALHATDWAMVVGVAGAALVLALARDPAAALTFAAIAVAGLAGNLVTRYSAPA
jgi:hypothetical protein